MSFKVNVKALHPSFNCFKDKVIQELENRTQLMKTEMENNLKHTKVLEEEKRNHQQINENKDKELYDAKAK